MKRGRQSETSYSGGTGDVNPQLLLIQDTMTAANTFTEVEQGIPIPRFGTPKGKSIVMEVLKAYWDLPEKDTNPAAGGELALVNAYLSTSSQASVAAAQSSPKTFMFVQKEYRGAFTAAGSYMANLQEPFVVDLTDGAGHGLLVGTESIFMGMTTSTFAGAGVARCRLLYRFKLVNVEEFIGIVQSQQ